MAPAKTIYVKDADMPLWERFEIAVKDWQRADSVSALLAVAMRQYLAQFGDQGDGLYVQAPDQQPATFGDGVAILEANRDGWILHLDEEVFGSDAYTPYELSARDLKDAIPEARSHMARVRQTRKASTEQDAIKAAARRLRAARTAEETAEEARGSAGGRAWALERAMPSELEAVVEIADSWWTSIDLPDDVDPDPWPTLLDEVDPEGRGIRRLERDPFLVAFFASAAETYKEVLVAERQTGEMRPDNLRKENAAMEAAELAERATPLEPE